MPTHARAGAGAPGSVLLAQPLGRGKEGLEQSWSNWVSQTVLQKKEDKSHQVSESKRKFLQKKNPYALSTLVTANFCCPLAGSYKTFIL